jgi:hypothetical protein
MIALRQPDPLEIKFADTLRGNTEDELELLAFNSPAVHFATYVTIRDKDNKAINPVPNILQLRTSEAKETMQGMGIKVRIIEVKPRRAGCSTFASHVLYHEAMRRPCEGITISDIKPHSKELLDKLREYSKTDTYPWNNQLIQDSANALGWANGSKWTVDTAENPDAGVGGTRQLFHGSESSKWPQTEKKNDKATMAAVLPSLSGQDTICIVESTPEGANGWHYETYQGAVTLDQLIEMQEQGICPEEIWVKVFAAWFEFADNARIKEVSSSEIKQIQDTISEHEREEIEKYSLTWEQVAWRRDTLKSVCNGDEKVFSYYYPSDEESCWLSSGTPIFDMAILCEMERAAARYSPIAGDLVMQEHDKQVIWHPQRDGTGDILIWEDPRENCRYLVTIDPANNISQTIGAKPDAHSISVWRDGFTEAGTNRWFPAKKVARVRPPYRADGDEVAGHAIRLSKYFGDCIIVQEVNIGLDIMRLLQLSGQPIFKRRPLSHRSGKVEEQVGFKTDKANREAIIQGLAAAIRNREIEVHCPHTIKEYKSFIRKANGKAEAAHGHHDDDVMADAMAWEAFPSATTYRKRRVALAVPADLHSWKRAKTRW